MMRSAASVVAGGLLVVGCATESQPDADDSLRELLTPPAYLADTESRLITSSAGRTYQVSIAVPRGYQSSTGSYPVLYSLDANGEFGIVVETARMLQLGGLIPELVIVGIGYPVGHFYDAIGPRAFDLTVTEDPALQDIWVSRFPGFPVPERSGGAPRFLHFLTDELIPIIDAEYRVDPGDRALFGHSMGGLFTFYAMLHGQGTYHRFIIASPMFSWDDRVSFEHEAAYAVAHDSLRAKAFLSVGMLEPNAPPEEDPWAGYITNLRDLAAVLERRSYAGFEWTAHFFENETHTSVVPASISRGLRYIYAAN